MADQNNPQYPPPLEHPPPLPPNRELSYHFFYSGNWQNATLPTLIIYAASDNPYISGFLDGLLDVIYNPERHSFICYYRNPPYPRHFIIPQSLHFLPPCGPIHFEFENSPPLPPFLHFPYQFQEEPAPFHLPPENNPGYPQNLIPGNRAYFYFKSATIDSIEGVVISSTTDNPWNNPLVSGFLDFEYIPEGRSLIPRIRLQRPAYPRYIIPPLLWNVLPPRVILRNVPLPYLEVMHSPPPSPPDEELPYQDVMHSPPPPNSSSEEEPPLAPVKRKIGEASSSGGSKKHQVQQGQRNDLPGSSSSSSG